MAEKNYALDPEIREKYFVEFYARFRDDIIVVLAGDPRSRKEFLYGLKRCSDFYKLKVESISPTSCVMLDLVLSKGRKYERCGILDVGIHTKPTSQGVPLCSSSWHLPSIHRSWPFSRLIHYKNVCGDLSSYREAAFSLFRKIMTYSPGHSCLEDLAVGMTAGNPCGNGKSVQKLVASSFECSRLILPHHPCFSRLQRTLESTHRSFLDLGIGFVKPVVVFSLGGKSIVRRMQSDCRAKLNEEFTGIREVV